MKKAESILYALILITALVTIMAKTFLWPWAGIFVILSFSTLAFIFSLLSFLIYTTVDEYGKRIYLLYGTIPLGFSIASLLIGMLVKFQHWAWESTALVTSVSYFVVTGLIFLFSYILLKNQTKKEFAKRMIFKTIVFIALNLIVFSFNFDSLISMLSTKELKEMREQMNERQKMDSIYLEKVKGQK